MLCTLLQDCSRIDERGPMLQQQDERSTQRFSQFFECIYTGAESNPKTIVLSPHDNKQFNCVNLVQLFIYTLSYFHHKNINTASRQGLKSYCSPIWWIHKSIMSIINGGSNVLTEVLVNVKGFCLDPDILFEVDLVPDQTFQARFGCLQLGF